MRRFPRIKKNVGHLKLFVASSRPRFPVENHPSMPEQA